MSFFSSTLKKGLVFVCSYSSFVMMGHYRWEKIEGKIVSCKLKESLKINLRKSIRFKCAFFLLPCGNHSQVNWSNNVDMVSTW